MKTTRVMAKLEPGGAQLSMLRVMRELRGRGIESNLLCGTASVEGLALARAHGVEPEVWAGGDNVQWTPHPAFAAWLAPRLLASELVHAHMFGGWWAAAVATPAGTPLVASEHNQYLWPDRPYPDELRAGFDRVDVFFGHGPGARATALEHGLPEDRLRTGISPVVGMQDRAHAELPSPRIVFAGRLHADKGPDVLLAALGQLEAPPVTLILGDGHLRPLLEEQAQALGPGKDVRFVGWVPDPGAYIAGATVLVVPSRDESFSQTAIIGLAHGVPVIGTDVDGFPLTLGDERGIIVAPGDPLALAAALRAVLDPERPRPGSVRDFTDRYQPARVADLYERTYRELLTRRPTSEPAAA